METTVQAAADEFSRRSSLARKPNGPRLRSRPKNSIDMNNFDLSTSSSTSSISPDSPIQNSSISLVLEQLKSSRSTSDIGVQVSQTDKKPSITTFIPPPPLPPPPKISFDSLPIPWKGLPYEAAQWTFTSVELQEIVSRAIKMSAKESFIRLLSIQALDTDIAKETERLQAERLAAQVKWRFEINRRTMLLQALNSSASIFASSGEPDKDNVIATLISQVASSIASCDSILASVMQISDQISQISLIQHRHWASALGIAVRKLNKAFSRQGEEMKRALIRIQTLEDELDEAWKEAEEMAVEIDHMEETDAEEDHLDDLDDIQTLGDTTLSTDLGQLVGVTAKGVLSKATLISPINSITPDARSIRSVKSSRSRRSNKGGPSRISRLSAAKTRSRAASNASLRLPKPLRAPTTPPVYPPPMPTPPDALQGCSFLDLDSNPQTPRKQLPDRAPEPTTSLPNTPRTAGHARTVVPPIWLEGDPALDIRSNSLDRSRPMHLSSPLCHGQAHLIKSHLTIPGNTSVLNTEPLMRVGVDKSPNVHKPGRIIDRSASAVTRLLYRSMDRPHSTLDNRSSGSFKFKLSPLSERPSSGIPANIISGGRYYSRGLPSYRSTESILENEIPRVGTANSG